MKVCVCVFKFCETTGLNEAKFHVVPPWDSGKGGNILQMIYVICCYLLLSTLGAGTLSRDFTTRCAGL